MRFPPPRPDVVAPDRKVVESRVIRVLIADDHPVVCLGLLAIINPQTDMTVVGQAKSGSEAIMLARKHSPDVILMDLRMPEMNGVDAIAAIRSERTINFAILNWAAATGLWRKICRTNMLGN